METTTRPAGWFKRSVSIIGFLSDLWGILQWIRGWAVSAIKDPSVFVPLAVGTAMLIVGNRHRIESLLPFLRKGNLWPVADAILWLQEPRRYGSNKNSHWLGDDIIKEARAGRLALWASRTPSSAPKRMEIADLERGYLEISPNNPEGRIRIWIDNLNDIYWFAPKVLRPEIDKEFGNRNIFVDDSESVCDYDMHMALRQVLSEPADLSIVKKPDHVFEAFRGLAYEGALQISVHYHGRRVIFGRREFGGIRMTLEGEKIVVRDLRDNVYRDPMVNKRQFLDILEDWKRAPLIRA